jgi:NTE family protein
MLLKKYRAIFLFLLLALTSCGVSHKICPDPEPEPLQSFYVPNRVRVALVLGSGGVRGMAHVGAIEELVKAGVPIDLIVGCSVGSLVGALYADNPCLEHLKYAVWDMKAHSIFDIDLWHCRYGLSQGGTLYRVIDDHLEAEYFDELQIPLVVVASDLHTGELVPIGSGDLVRAVRASCSIPFVFVPCKMGGRVLVDGGVINPVPVKVAKDLGADVVIAVDLGELLDQTFPTNLFQVATRSAEIAFMWQNEVCVRSADVVIRPKTCGVGAFNDKMKWAVYEAGKEAVREKLPQIQELLCSLSPPANDWDLVTLKPYTSQICIEEEELEEKIAEAESAEAEAEAEAEETEIAEVEI